MLFSPDFDSLGLKGVDPDSLSAKGVGDRDSQPTILPGRPIGRRKWAPTDPNRIVPGVPATRKRGPNRRTGEGRGASPG